MARNLALVPPTASSGTDPHYDHELDARGLSCPLPVLNTRKSLESLGTGEVLKVISTDKGCVSFFESLVRQNALELLSWHEQDGEFSFFLRRN